MAVTNHNIFVFVEAYDGVPTGSARRLIGKCRQLGDELGCYVEALCPFDNEKIASGIIQLGADHCYQPRIPVPPSSWDTFLSDTISTLRPEFLILPSSPTCNTVAGIIAGTKGLPLLLNCVSLSLDTATRTLNGQIHLYNGTFQVSQVAKKIDPQIATLHAQKLPEPYPDTSRSGVSRKLEYAVSPAHASEAAQETRHSDLDDQPKIAILIGSKVSKERDRQLIETFAKAINAPIVSGEDWFSEEKMLRLFTKANLVFAIELDHDPSMFLRLPSTCRVIAISSDKEEAANIADIFIRDDFRQVLRSLLERWKEEQRLLVTQSSRFT